MMNMGMNKKMWVDGGGDGEEEEVGGEEEEGVGNGDRGRVGWVQTGRARRPVRAICSYCSFFSLSPPSLLCQILY